MLHLRRRMSPLLADFVAKVGYGRWVVGHLVMSTGFDPPI